MNAIANVERRELAPIEVLKNTVARKADDFKMVLPSHITVDKFQRTIATAALSNAQLLNCDRQSLLIAAMRLAQDGLLPDGREAALVPFKQWNRETRETTWQVQAMPMVYGLRKKILQSGEVLSLQVGVVYADELNRGFIYEIGIEPPVRHRPDLLTAAEDRTDDKIVAAYSIARIRNGDGEPLWSVEVMARHEIDKVRQASQTGAVGKTTRDGKAIAPKGPWVEWFAEMAKKTVLRRHSKMLPMSGDLIDTFDRDDAEEQRAQGAARLLEAQEEKPLALPSTDDLDARATGDDEDRFDPDTGEVLQCDSRGMTEVNEETARALDNANDGTLSDDNLTAQEGPADEQRGESHTDQQADFVGAKPNGSDVKPGQSWFNPDDGKTRYAHGTPQGIKWYASPPEQKPAEQPGEAARLRAEIAAAQDLATLSDIQERFGEAKAGLSEADVKDIRNELATRRNALA